MKCVWFLVVSAIGVAICIEHDFKGFDDSILFGINWPGSRENLENLVDGDIQKRLDQTDSKKETLTVLTSDKEKYQCILPEFRATETKSIEEYEGPSPIELLKPLFAQKICSYRLESYWSYELCHGRYIRQYHEERDGKLVKSQEYYLGHWTPEQQTKLEAEINAAQARKELPKTTKVEGTALPYVEMVMDDGTICDLSGKPRITRVQYVCYVHGKHEVYSFKETSTCEYEIIILSALLCEHPQFKPKEVSENIIDCLAVGDAPKKPRKMLEQEVESLRFHHQNARYHGRPEREPKDVLAVLRAAQINQDGTAQLRFEIYPVTDDEESAATEPPKTPTPEDKSQNIGNRQNDDSHIRAFLSGEFCLNGGSGWWKYEFCYGKHVTQYHEDRSGVKTTVLLGKFDEEAHLNWIMENKRKAPKPLDKRTSLSHFYSNGDICDKTDKPRQTEVKLKCLENSSSSAQISLYLLEPRTCHYILGVESPLICDILPLADENGLVKQLKTVLAGQEASVDTHKEKEPKDAHKIPIIAND